MLDGRGRTRNSGFEYVQFKRYLKPLNGSSWIHKSRRKTIQAGMKNGGQNHGMDKSDQKRVYSIKSLKQTLRNGNLGRMSTGKDCSEWDQEVGISKE